MDLEREPAGAFPSSVDTAEWRRLRILLAVEAVETLLCLLDPPPAEGLEIRALERVRDDLEVVLRIDEIERQL
jgi:uncharacterized protein (DUF1778 family)